MNKLIAASMVILIGAPNFAMAKENHPSKNGQMACSRAMAKTKMANARKVFKKGDLKEAIHILEALMDCAYKEKYEHGTIKEGTYDVIELLSQSYFANKDFEKCVEITSNFATQSETVFAQYQSCLKEQVKSFGEQLPSSECKAQDLMNPSGVAIAAPMDFANQIEMTQVERACLYLERKGDANIMQLTMSYLEKGQSKPQKKAFNVLTSDSVLSESILNDEELNCSLAAPEILNKNKKYFLHLRTDGAVRPCSGGKSLDEVHEFYEILKNGDLKRLESIKINLEG
jgi:hypothetical protein